jgi:thiol-disulfide isomerase/thioredoxin
MKRYAVLCVFLWAFSTVCADTPSYEDSLSLRQQRVYESVLSEFDFSRKEGSLKELYRAGHDYAQRLANYAAWECSRGYQQDYVMDKLRNREEVFFPESDPADISMPEYFVGDSAAPIDIVAYISSNCPHCKRYGIPLYEAIAQNPHRARFAIKPINDIVADKALIAAAKKNRIWDLFQEYGTISERLEDEVVINAAANAGLRYSTLTNIMTEHREEIDTRMEEFNREAERLQVRFVPTFYINGREYTSSKDAQWILDYVDYLLEENRE